MVGEMVYVLMDYKERGTVYTRAGFRSKFNLKVGRVQDVFGEQLEEPVKKSKREESK